jgi:hydrogenase maturation protease
MATKLNTTLLIGYGNECCGDDALGPTVVRTIDAMGLPNVIVLVVHQLMPELAEPLASAGRAIFVDATRAPQSSPIVTQRLQADREAAILTHSYHPSALIALSELLYGRSPPAWLVTISGSQFRPGDVLSAQARSHSLGAVELITSWMQSSTGKALQLLP